MSSRQENYLPSTITSRLAGILLTLMTVVSGTPLQAATVTSVATPFVLEKTNSDRIVVGSYDILHAVYVEGDSPGSTPIIKYVWSNSQGATWSSPQTLASGIAPALAVDDNGELALAYVGPPYGPAAEPQSGAIYYMRKSPDSSNALPWSSPVKIIESGASPSLNGYEGTMHLAWASYVVKYATFATLTPPVTPLTVSQGEDVEPTLLCGGTKRVAVPSLAVAPRGSGQPPIVRVAFYSSYDTRTASSCGGSLKAGVYVYDRPLNSSSPFWPYWFPLVSDENSTTASSVSYGRVSVSLTANRLSSTFFGFYSDVWNGDRVRLTRLPASGSASISNFSEYTGGLRALTDITAIGAPNGDSFKIGYTPLTSSNSHGNTLIRIGSWRATAGAPSFATVTDVNSLVRNANVVYFDRPATNGVKGINAFFEVKVSDTSYRLDVDYFNRPALTPLPCAQFVGRCDSIGRQEYCTDDVGNVPTCECVMISPTKNLWFCTV